jgi:hypothetical protein
VRFARVGVSRAWDSEEIALVTESSGALRHHLPPGDFRLRLSDSVETDFSVAGRWTLVRMRLF